MRLLTILILTFAYFSSRAQNPVNWQFSAKKTSDDTYELHITAYINKPWHIYSQFMAEGGPVPTKITFAKNPLVVSSGNIDEHGNLETKHEEVFDMDVKYFSDSVDFVQTVKLKQPVKTAVSGTVHFMVCTNQQCLPVADKPFTIALR